LCFLWYLRGFSVFLVKRGMAGILFRTVLFFMSIAGEFTMDANFYLTNVQRDQSKEELW
jgi:hypothetical protein